MADFISVGSAGAATLSTGQVAIPRTNLRQELILSPDIFQWMKEGRIYTAQAGALSTAETITATAIIRQQPDLMLRVPAGTVVVPLMVQIAVATSVGLVQAAVSTCNNDPGTSNVTAVTPVNLNSRFATKVSAVSAYKTATGATGTAPTNVADLYRWASADPDSVASNSNPFTYAPYGGQGVPCVVGDGSAMNAFLVYLSAATSGTAWIVGVWAEFTYAEFYGS